ncbi:tetratricopeptide repeat protein [Pseudonocardiaceae bacterium YIM PH 21723]|nr:tetratricopeptide repeat protein [Pseudonocardiaceae bacterium YIM PH 21723]
MAADNSIAAGHVGVINFYEAQRPEKRPVPQNLPKQPSNFTDRREVVDTICSMESAEDSRIFAVSGMAGVGKSAVVTHAAHRMAADFPDGQVFLDMRAYTPDRFPLRVDEAVGALLEIVHVAPQGMPSTIEGRLSLWRSIIADRRMLVVLDNVQGIDKVSELLPGRGKSRVLMTCRRRMDIVHGVTPIDLEVLPSRDAAVLFVSSAGLDEQAIDDTGVQRLVALCGNLPLAINLAAATLRKHRSWSVDDLIDRLTQLDEGIVAALDNRAVEAAFELSFRDLGERARSVFLQLALHPCSEFTVNSVAALCGFGKIETQELMETLFDHFLIEEVRRDRYRIHDLLKQFSRRIMQETLDVQEREVATRRLYEFVKWQCLAAARLVPGPSGYLLAEYGEIPAGNHSVLDSYISAIDWFRDELSGIIESVQHAESIDLTPYSWELSAICSHMMRICGDPRVLAEISESAFRSAERYGNLPVQCEALFNIGLAQMNQSRHREAEGALRGSAELAEIFGDQIRIGLTYAYLGAISQMQGQYEEALERLAKASETFVEHPYPPGEAMVLGVSGVVYLQWRDADRALESFSRAREIFHDLGDLHEESNALTHLGVVYERLLQDYDQALVYLGEALDLNRKLGDRYGEGWTLSDIGLICRAAEDFDGAAANLRLSLEILNDVNDQQGVARVLVDLASVERSVGRLDVARELLARALDSCERDSRRREQASALVELAILDLRVGKPSDSLAWLVPAQELHASLGDRFGQVRVLTTRGDALAALNDLTAAGEVWAEALGLARTLPHASAQIEELLQRVSARD